MEQPRDKVDLTLFVACYNEEERIIPTLETLISALAETPLTWEIIIIDDASRDQSVNRIREFVGLHPQYSIDLKVNVQNKGLAQNFVDGAFLGSGTYYRLVCGDDVESKDTLTKVFGQIGKADIITSYHAQCQGRSAFRRGLSRLFTSLVNLISGYRLRYYNGLAVYHRYHVQRWHSNTYGFGFQADLLTRLLDEGFSFIEVPVVGGERQGGASNALTLKNFLSVTHTLASLAIRRLGKIMFRPRRQIPTSSPTAAISNEVENSKAA